MSLRYEDCVFINCPFDEEYRPLFQAIVFTVHYAGFFARCSLEVSDASQNRFDKIMDIIAETAYGIHDISRTELDADNGLPRFNMPLELGVFLGCKRYGGRKQRLKCCLVMDREKYRYQKFISDIAGQDVRSHDADPRVAVSQVRKFLRTQSKRTDIPGETRIWGRFRIFQERLPALCEELEITVDELEFVDYQNFVIAWLKKRGTGPIPHEGEEKS